MHPSSPAPRPRVHLPPKSQVVLPPHTGTFRPIMPGGAVATGDGIGANAPRNVWAGILSVRFLSSSTYPPPSDRHPPSVDLLRRLWWYPLRL